MRVEKERVEREKRMSASREGVLVEKEYEKRRGACRERESREGVRV